MGRLALGDTTLARVRVMLREGFLEDALTERDNAEDWADRLAAFFDEGIGEHSALNNPWRNALDLLDEAQSEMTDKELKNDQSAS